MLTVNHLAETDVIQILPSSKVSKASITKAAKDIQGYLNDGAHALLIESKDFEGWDDFATVIGPLIAEKSRCAIDHIAICTDKPTGDMGGVLRSLYSETPVNIYCHFELESAKQWLNQESIDSVF